MNTLKISSIDFIGEHYFVTFTFDECVTKVIEDRHHIEIRVMVPLATKIEDVEAVALDKVRKDILYLTN